MQKQGGGSLESYRCGCDMKAPLPDYAYSLAAARNVAGGARRRGWSKRKQQGGTCPCMMRGGYRPTARNLKYLAKYRRGNSIGFTMKASLKAKGLIPRTSKTLKGKKVLGPKYRGGGLFDGLTGALSTAASKASSATQTMKNRATLGAAAAQNKAAALKAQAASMAQVARATAVPALQTARTQAATLKNRATGAVQSAQVQAATLKNRATGAVQSAQVQATALRNRAMAAAAPAAAQVQATASALQEQTTMARNKAAAALGKVGNTVKAGMNNAKARLSKLEAERAVKQRMANTKAFCSKYPNFSGCATSM